MGRCNNKRAQQRALELRNTPARARFSNRPKKKVVEKIAERVNHSSSKPPSSTTAATRTSTSSTPKQKQQQRNTNNPYENVDLSHLDELLLSETAVQLMEGLLRDLNVLEATKPNEEESSRMATAAARNEGEDDHAGLEEEEEEERNLPTTTTTTDSFESNISTNDPIYIHLTTRLSFSHSAAERVCLAMPGWQGTKSAPSSLTFEQQLSLALDWLSLHLTEDELSQGFQVSASSSAMHHRPVHIKFKADPSISVAPKLTEDADYLVSSRAVDFVKLGFSYADAVSVLKKKQEFLFQSRRDALDEEDLLRQLLSLVEEQIVGQVVTNEFEQEFDEEALEEEVEQEREVLNAIYDDAFQVLSSSRYKVVLPTEEDQTSCLHVFLRHGYPALVPPLYLFYHEHFASPLLRRIHAAIVEQAHASVGHPSVFEIVTFLSENVAAIKEDFEKEVRAKEFEAEQFRMRKEVGHVMDEEDEADLGRRRRARLKALEKAYDRDDQAVQREFRERQERRLEKVHEENANIRSRMVELTLKKKDKERQQEEIERVRRAAMSAALNSGQSKEQARAASDKAERKFLREHGLLDSSASSSDIDEDAASEESNESGEDDFEDEGTGSDDDLDPQPRSAVKATPKTTAFMDRLRAMYNEAAAKKGGIRLAEPVEKQDEEELVSKAPCPVATPVGEIAEIVNDVINTQKEQPWLLSKDARVPYANGDDIVYDDDAGAEDQRGRSDLISRELQRDLSKREEAKEYSKMLKQRERLPAFQMKDEVLSAIQNNQVCVIAAATGAGKSTQLPQLVLDDLILRNEGSKANIIVTQPRRISAIGVSERVAAERADKIGGIVGYSIKLEKKASKKTRLLFCTTGILLRRLQCDPDLASVSHVFLDEVHERDLNTDFLLIILKDLLRRRKSLKLILMSATLNADAFAAYFDNCAFVSIPGRTFPVKEFRLEDVIQMTKYQVDEDSDYAVKQNAPRKWSKSALRKRYYPRYDSATIHALSVINEAVINYELIALLLQHIATTQEDGAILVFLPGLLEILNAMDAILKIELFQSTCYRIIPLHSTLSSAEQSAVFEVPPQGVRKIVLATNIAETSITIEDVVYVVDTGRVKENQRDEVKETPALVECWVSRASSKQRRGRAGRVKPGIAYTLFSSHTFEEEMQDYQLPEMLRVGLEDLALQILTLDLGEPSEFLAKAMNPPSLIAMKNSLALLERLGAVECCWQNDSSEQNAIEEVVSEGCQRLDVSTELTALGFHLASLPVEPRVGKMMVYGALLGCVDESLTIAAAMTTSKPLFVSPFGQRDAADEARRSHAIAGSDHLTALAVFQEWKKLRKMKGRAPEQTFLKDNFLNRSTLFQIEELKRHYINLLADIGFLPRGYRPDNHVSMSSSQTGIVDGPSLTKVKAVLCAGLYPNVIVAPKVLVNGEAKQEAGELPFRSHRKGDVYLHPSTVSFKEKQLESRYCCFHEIVQTSKLYVRDCTPINPLALLLFGGSLDIYRLANAKSVATIDRWLEFRIPMRHAALVKHLRLQMETVLLQKIVSPGEEVDNSATAKALVDSIGILLGNEEAKAVTTNSIEIQDGREIVRPFHFSAESSGRGRGRGRGGRGRRRGRSDRSANR